MHIKLVYPLEMETITRDDASDGEFYLRADGTVWYRNALVPGEGRFVNASRSVVRIRRSWRGSIPTPLAVPGVPNKPMVPTAPAAPAVNPLLPQRRHIGQSLASAQSGGRRPRKSKPRATVNGLRTTDNERPRRASVNEDRGVTTGQATRAIGFR